MTNSPIKLLLTFDDGPHPVWTPKILNVLDSGKTKGIFFCVGYQAEKFPDVAKEIIDRGHVVGNHMWSHKPFRSLMRSTIENEIAQTHNYFIQKHNYRIKLFRPPWGIITSKTRSYIESKWGYKILLWDIDTRDYIWPYPRHLSFPTDKIYKPVQVLLLHDGSMYSPISSKSHTINTLQYLLDHQGQDYNFMNPEEIL